MGECCDKSILLKFSQSPAPFNTISDLGGPLMCRRTRGNGEEFLCLPPWKGSRKEGFLFLSSRGKEVMDLFTDQSNATSQKERQVRVSYEANP
jgi:hypothetical protein